MLTIIVPTLDSERAMVPTLAALVSGATEGLLSEVLLADGGSQDDTAAIADVTGCNVMRLEGSLGGRLKAAAAAARAPWLLFMRPGTVLDRPWIGDARRFMEVTRGGERAAVFRRGVSAGSPWREALAQALAALGAAPRPDQGLLISRQFYDALGGHDGSAADPEAELIRRVGRRRITRLTATAHVAS
jgi:glycosyltransferase involved in cell wall biosynthesis